ncbi:hypothetical protein K3181_09305 [Qipengyuania sp. YG27]|uniref:Uncharacterized protein n=1 Tax=Qipengyuania mesophila TaxID=2867246 RepID=A0ABS7JVE8_9SPHN|nr:hypothetical protein [Qipengyuania mesophila]MBX7501638.1 hypothetical protein [Qipengyuania mesophila]
MSTPTRLDRWLASISRSLELCCHHATGGIPKAMLRRPARQECDCK